MIKHLSGCEEKIVEELAWQSNSSLWSHLRCIKLNTPLPPSSSSTNPNSISQMDIAFPLNDDVYIASTQLTQYHLHHHHHFPHQTHSKITATLTNSSDTMNTSTGTSSPIKQAPTITRVVCNNTIDSSPLKSNITLTQQQQQIQSQLQPPQSPAAVAAAAVPPRLKNVSKFVACFFRKFYALTNTRIRSLIEKLELAHASLDLFNQNKNVIYFLSNFLFFNFDLF